MCLTKGNLHLAVSLFLLSLFTQREVNKARLASPFLFTFKAVRNSYFSDRKSHKGRRTPPPMKKRSRRNCAEEVASKQREKVNEEEPLGKFTGLADAFFSSHKHTHTLYTGSRRVLKEEGGNTSIFIFPQASQVFIPRP